jgi:hypothetical protein
MSGPNDSSAGDAPTGDFKLPLGEPDGRALSPRYKLHLHWDTPRLEWRPNLAAAQAPRDQPEFLRLGDPLAAVSLAERYILNGAFLFDMQRPRFDLINKAFLEAPTAPPQLLPSFAQMKAAQDDAFYRRLGRPAPLFGAPAAPTSLLTPPTLGPPPPSPFYKLPDPSALRADPAAPKAGSAGDILKGFMGLPIVQINMKKLSDEGLAQVHLLQREFKDAPWRDRIIVIALVAPLAAGAVGAVLGADDARHFTFDKLKGVDVPIPFVPGLSARFDDFGRADPFLLGKPTDPRQPRPVQFGLKFDVLKAIPAIRKLF